MDTYNLSHKLRYAGRRSPVPFTTGPEYLNSVPGVPVLAELRIFIPPEDWSEDSVKVVSREICRILGPTAQFDIGMTLSGTPTYEASRAAAGNIARLMKMDPTDATVTLRYSEGLGDRLFQARFPRLQFEPTGEDYWRAMYSTGAVKVSTEQ
jgi:hypothetical protein